MFKIEVRSHDPLETPKIIEIPESLYQTLADNLLVCVDDNTGQEYCYDEDYEEYSSIME